VNCFTLDFGDAAYGGGVRTAVLLNHLRRPVMPTAIPLQAVESDSDDRPASIFSALLQFYGLFALVLMSLTAIEMHYGMYPGLTLSEAFLRTAGIDAESGATIPDARESVSTCATRVHRTEGKAPAISEPPHGAATDCGPA
jgi:hypothetical protein